LHLEPDFDLYLLIAMRLNSQQINIIRNGIANHLGAHGGLWLYGSRVDDNRRGGDIDLYIETTERKSLRQIIRCKMELEEKLDLHVDLAIKYPGDDRPIYNIAKSTGIKL
jgi:predicted nucleotidyltransferase